MRARSTFVLRPVLAASVLLLSFWPALPAARQAALPTGRQVVDRHLAAVGGTAAFAKVKSIRMRGRLEIVGQRIGGDLELLSARPAKMLYRVQVPGIGRIETGYNGKIGWSVSPIAGPELMSGRQLTETAEEALFDAPLRAPNRVKQLTTSARTDFDGRPAYQVRVVFSSGTRQPDGSFIHTEQTDYFDVETGFQIGSESTRVMPQGAVPTVSVLRDYKKFGPLMHPTTFIQRALGAEQLITITSCEYDVVPDSAFDPPPDVKALIAR
jgi:hypothetical protein